MDRRYKGFSLVEVMVGLGIGMLAMVVIMQVFSVFEGGKRAATSGADTQSNGAIALFMLEQDVKMAGWGMSTSLHTGCRHTFAYCDGSESCDGARGALSDFNFASLKVEDGGSGPDTIVAQYFASPKQTAFTLPRTTTVQTSMQQPSSEVDVVTVSGCQVGDMALASQSGNCTLMQITGIQETVNRLQHNSGTGGPFNPTAAFMKANNWPAYTTGAQVSCFRSPASGPLFYRKYSVNTTTRQLVREESDASLTTDVIAPEIMDLQVQYGIAAGGGSQVVKDWVDASGDTWAHPTLDNINRIKAIRLALVARSTQYERPQSGQACGTTTPEMVEKWSSWATFNTTKYPSDWQCYRYKVFESIIPLRNVLWGNV